MDSLSRKRLLAAAAATPPMVVNMHTSSLSLSEAIKHSGKKGWDGGKSGALSMGVNVCTLMWVRTTMNYQYRYGTTTTQAMRKLWADGGIRRFYRGFPVALFQGPLGRFGDTAANSAILALLEPYDMPIFMKTGAASITAGLWRFCLMPIDTVKTTLQVEGKNGLALLGTKIRGNGIFVTFHGALAAASATAVSQTTLSF